MIIQITIPDEKDCCFVCLIYVTTCTDDPQHSIKRHKQKISNSESVLKQHSLIFASILT